ncbi:MAG: HDIG domain-containing protein [Phycisphaerae bacterium]|jgi:cyclic-di-AMP phosphodiesterase PgpH|nr:HDIG domain-containing protein [Phycisphaerae bacterium]MBT5365165.1 HDIG domain-containing protein [Phycisphaerae bacterium]MBT6269409.1 HDIG domain-containing protein [Phycisphaerae bacterium]MBT6282187.1 HDIG domain-containing protein [Phycisphaerae bacterium]
MAKSSGQKNKVSSKSRRKTVLKNVPKPSLSVLYLLRRPEFLRTCFIIFLFLVVVSILATWSGEQIKVHDGQIATETRIKRINFQFDNAAATEAKRAEVRNSSPKIYIVNSTFIERLKASLNGLPTAVSGKVAVEDVSPELVTQFNLTPESLLTLQSMSKNGEPTYSWTRSVSKLIQNIQQNKPLLTSEEFQVFTTTPSSNRELFIGAGRIIRPYQADAVPLPVNAQGEPDLKIAELISSVDFPESLVPIIGARLLNNHQPSILLDVEDTQARAEAAAVAVVPVIVKHIQGEIIWRKGDSISATQYENAILEQQHFFANSTLLDRWLPRIGSIGLLAMLAVFIGAYTTSANPRVAKNPLRLLALCALMSLMLGLSVIVTLQSPAFIFASAIVPTLLVVTIVSLAYGQRMGMFIAFMQCALVTMALSQSIAWFILLIAGCGMMISQVREVRQRQTLIHASGKTAITFAIGALFLGLAKVSDISIAWQPVVTDSLFAGASALVVGFFVLGILPSIESVFDITTGMTLADLRDPRKPLLKQLQQLAPGTFNHSRQVADIAETATEAIGGDSLLAYVGGLYHDIGKMNKPEYFIENQTGYNRHKDLKPSMSLLVIIGHVKDGIELGKEYDLPRELIHFIEAHHGTTLVEYFYHAALKSAEEIGEPINESQFRYPGPRPKTKEAAVLMIADAVESASRALPDPNPARIETLVRDLSRKRLLDHQFDECGLTFTDLAKVEDAIIARLNSIYHTRIKYPEDDVSDANDLEIIEAEETNDIAG